MVAMEMLSSWCLSYCLSGKCERAACRSVLTLCKWLLADWKDLTPQLKQVGHPPFPHLSAHPTVITGVVIGDGLLQIAVTVVVALERIGEK